MMSEVSAVDELKVAQYVDWVIKESVTQMGRGGSQDVPQPRDTTAESSAAVTAQEEVAGQEVVYSSKAKVNDKQLSTSHLVNQLYVNLIYNKISTISFYLSSGGHAEIEAFWSWVYERVV